MKTSCLNLGRFEICMLFHEFQVLGVNDEQLDRVWRVGSEIYKEIFCVACVSNQFLFRR